MLILYSSFCSKCKERLVLGQWTVKSIDPFAKSKEWIHTPPFVFILTIPKDPVPTCEYLVDFFSGTVVILVSNSGQHSGLRFRFVNFLRGHRGWRDVDSLYSWAFKYLPSLVTQLNYQAFMDNVVDSEDPWIIDFYAPWCGHCIQFAPHYEKVAKVSQFGNNFVSIYIYKEHISSILFFHITL